MPDIVTHATFALDIAEQFQNREIVEMIKNNLTSYVLGAQGPDIFYFNKEKDKSLRGLGNQMHTTNINAFFIESLRYLKKHYNEALFCYILGFLTHNALDRNTHPYVYHVTGKETVNYRGNHMRLERAIDSIFIKERWNCEKPHCFKIHKQFLSDKIDKRTFKDFYDEVISKVFHMNDGGALFIKSLRIFKLYIKILHDRFGLKKKLATMIDKYFNKSSMIVLESLFHYNNIKEHIDYLNLNHQEWNHPIKKDVVSNLSFLEMYEKGLNEAILEIESIVDYINNKVGEEDLKLKDLSYETGLDWRIKEKMQYFNIIFK